MHACSKEQFDKLVHLRKFPVGSKVFVSTSDRQGLSKKLAKPFKGPYVCILVKPNNTIKLVPISGGRPISTHINNCKLAPYRDQHLLFSEPSVNNEETTSTAVPDPNFFRYSKHDSDSFPFNDDSPSDEQFEPSAPPTLQQIWNLRVPTNTHHHHLRYRLAPLQREEPEHVLILTLLLLQAVLVLAIVKMNLQVHPELELRLKTPARSYLPCLALDMIAYRLNVGSTRERSSCRIRSQISKIAVPFIFQQQKFFIRPNLLPSPSSERVD